MVGVRYLGLLCFFSVHFSDTQTWAETFGEKLLQLSYIVDTFYLKYFCNIIQRLTDFVYFVCLFYFLCLLGKLFFLFVCLSRGLSFICFLCGNATFLLRQSFHISSFPLISYTWTIHMSPCTQVCQHQVCPRAIPTNITIRSLNPCTLPTHPCTPINPALANKGFYENFPSYPSNQAAAFHLGALASVSSQFQTPCLWCGCWAPQWQQGDARLWPCYTADHT